MTNLLFNPNGRILRNRFWQGMVIMTVLSVLVAAGSVKLGFFFGLLAYALIYPYICVYGKRFHDAGLSAWLVLVVFVVTFILSGIVGSMLNPFFMGAAEIAMQEEMTERMLAGDMAGMMEGAELLAAKLLPVTLISTVIVNAIAAIVVGMLPTQPAENKHGPVPGTDAADSFS
ncbi:MAG: DUF805 domain-containing protein [Henriciella sp.]|mgnify:FL=1|nr:DUF805 domain-containing protein [Henriciella sp.]